VTSLSDRKTKLVFETSDQVRERGAWRTVIVEARPGHCVLRLKGCRTSFTLCYGTAYQVAQKLAADAARREKAAKKGKR
jgi:hypothetical protein